MTITGTADMKPQVLNNYLLRTPSEVCMRTKSYRMRVQVR
jgi:hypothetical protein